MSELHGQHLPMKKSNSSQHLCLLRRHSSDTVLKTVSGQSSHSYAEEAWRARVRWARWLWQIQGERKSRGKLRAVWLSCHESACVLVGRPHPTSTRPRSWAHCPRGSCWVCTLPCPVELSSTAVHPTWAEVGLSHPRSPNLHLLIA